MAASLIALNIELIEIALRSFRDIKEYRGIAYRLFETLHMEIYGAARQVVARW